MIKMSTLIHANDFQRKFDHFKSCFKLIGEVGLEADNRPIGRYGRVYHLLDIHTNKHYAYKVYNRYTDPKTSREIALNEIALDFSQKEGDIIKNKTLPYVIKYYGSFDHDGLTGKEPGILMDFFDGKPLSELTPRIQSSLSISTNTDLEIDEHTLLKITRKILIGLLALHELEIAHRDIKLDNILYQEDPVTQEYDVRIIDLGFAGNNSKQFPLKSRRGTAFYMAPEILSGLPALDLPMPASRLIPGDIWALGLCLYVLTNNGEFPFDADNMEKLIQVVCNNLNVTFTNIKMPTINMIIADCLLPFEKRPSAKELLERYYSPV